MDIKKIDYLYKKKRMKTITELLKDISLLPDTERQMLIQEINKGLGSTTNSIEHLVEVRHDIQEQEKFSCPYCGGEKIVGHGNYKGRKRYKCKSCEKTFNDLTGTSVAHLHKKTEWQIYLKCVAQSMTIRASAKKAGVSYRTAFMWRHKIISAFKDIGCVKLDGIVESDETFFLFSEKGNKNITGRKPRKRKGKASKAGINDEHVAVIVSADRNHKHPIAEVAGRGRVSTKKVEGVIGKWLGEEASVLCTDSHKSYGGFAKQHGLKHVKINASKGQFVKDKVYHIQNINGMHSLLKDWMKKFKGGVASGYLQNYLNWFRVIRTVGDNLVDYLTFALMSKNAFIPIKNIKPQYIIS